jgi:SAM-dependent methyltransferase
MFPGFVVTAADTVVDVGCGAGHSCLIAAEVGAEVIATDIDPKAIAQVKQALREASPRSFRALVSDSNPLPLPDGIATVVLAREVMEHVDDPEGFLRELVRIGKPGTRYLISVPDPASEALMRVVAPPDYFQKPGHLRVFERQQLASLVESAGLEIETRIFTGFYWSMWWVLRWTTGTHFAPLSSDPPPAVLKHWDKTWQALQKTAAGQKAIQALDEAIPKSQVLYARKPEVRDLSFRARF